MKQKQPNWLVVAAVLLLWGVVMFISLGVLVRNSPGQPPQPGDIAAPVVDGPDVFETGLLTASISCPRQVAAGSVLVLDVSGSSEGTRELIVRPTVPSGSIYHDSDGIHIVVWTARTGHYVALWVVTSGRDIETAQVAFEVVAGDVPDDPDDPPEPPEDTDFVKWVRKQTKKVEAANHASVADTFRTLATAIDAAPYEGTRVIQADTEKALFGPAGAQNEAWDSWFNVVFPRMLADRLSTAGGWAKAYREIARAIE